MTLVVGAKNPPRSAWCSSNTSVQPSSVTSAVRFGSAHARVSPSGSVIGGSSGTGSAGGGSGSTCERSQTGPRRNRVRGRSPGSRRQLPSSELLLARRHRYWRSAVKPQCRIRLAEARDRERGFRGSAVPGRRSLSPDSGCGREAEPVGRGAAAVAVRASGQPGVQAKPRPPGFRSLWAFDPGFGVDFGFLEPFCVDWIPKSVGTRCGGFLLW